MTQHIRFLLKTTIQLLTNEAINSQVFMILMQNSKKRKFISWYWVL